MVPSGGKDPWNKSVIIPSNGIPANTHFLKLEFSGGSKDFSPQLSEIFINIPGNPSDLKAGPLSGTKVVLTWNDNSVYETGYLIERKQNGNFNLIDSVTQNVTSYIDSNVAIETTYIYRVQAYTTQITSGFSNSDTVFLNKPLNAEQLISSTIPVFFPNPSTGVIHFYQPLPESTIISIFTATGKLAFIDSNAGNKSSIDLKNMPVGLYFMVIESDKENAYFKLLLNSN